ncbi:MAG: replication factor A, partial [Candidatus Methanoperedens sp.]
MKEIAKQIEARFLELGVKVQTSEIETQLDQLINKFKVPPEEARRNVVNSLLVKHNIPKANYFATHDTPQVKTSDIKEDGNWVSVRGK